MSTPRSEIDRGANLGDGIEEETSRKRLDPRSILGSRVQGPGTWDPRSQDLESTTARGSRILDPRIHRGSNLDDGIEEEEDLEEEARSSIDPRVEGPRSSDLGSEILRSRIHDGPRVLELRSEDRSRIEPRPRDRGGVLFSARRGRLAKRTSTGTPLDEKARRLKWVPRDARTAPSLKKPCSCARRSPRSHADEPSAAWPFLRAKSCL